MATLLAIRNKVLNGTTAADSMTGTDINDTLFGGLGADTLWGGAGNDTLWGGDGNDSLLGEAGNDLMRGGTGLDTMLGGSGNDTLQGEAGNDSLLGGDGNDVLDGGDGDDFLSGEAGADMLRGGAGNDFIFAGDGNDSVQGGAGNDTLRTGTGDDQVKGDDGDDMLCGADGNDILQGMEGNDVLWGGNGNDLLKGGYANDLMIGGAGDDRSFGCEGNDFLLSRSDAGEPEIAAAPGTARVNGNLGLFGNDNLDGGPDADLYRFELLTNARASVIAANLNSDGTINWNAVSNANAARHDHWVEGIGNDTVWGMNTREGDRMEIYGDDIVFTIEERDVLGDSSPESIIILRAGSNNFANAGDLLGTITVVGQRITANEITIVNQTVGAFDRPGDGPLPADKFGLFPVGWAGLDDWAP